MLANKRALVVFLGVIKYRFNYLLRNLSCWNNTVNMQQNAQPKA
jgi:hypothetical protein